MKTRFCYIVLAFMVSQGVFAFDRADSLISRVEHYQRGMGAVSVFRNGMEVYQRCYGSTAIGKANDSTSLFRIGSVSKTFTAAIIFKLIEEGRLQLNDPLEKWFPLFGNARLITVRHLLGHRSGLYNFTNDGAYNQWKGNPITRSELHARLLMYPNIFMPDEKTEYSNTNYVLLTWIAEDASGEGFDELLDRIVVKPASLQKTFVYSDSTMNIADSYRFRYEWELMDTTHESVALGAGALVSTPTDLNRFLYALFNGKIITHATLQLMMNATDGVGFGLFKAPFYDRQAWGHSGVIDGFQSRAFYFIEDSVAIAVTANAASYPLNELMIGVLSDVFDLPFELPVFHEYIAVDPETLKQYEGEYAALGVPVKITVRIENGALVGQGTAQPSFPLVCTGRHRFSFDAGGIVIEFQPERRQLVLQQMGRRIIMKK
jgi:D-alanyl-D-alanine carboxypeptidase